MNREAFAAVSRWAGRRFRMRVRILILMAATLPASACDNSQPTQPRQPIVVRSQAQDQLHKLDGPNRDIALKRAILDSGLTCRRVTRSGYVQEHENLSMWTANCDDKIDYAVFVGPDSSVQVRRCDELARFGLPACVIHENIPPKPAASG
jgi:hypothetical protein